KRNPGASRALPYVRRPKLHLSSRFCRRDVNLPCHSRLALAQPSAKAASGWNWTAMPHDPTGFDYQRVLTNVRKSTTEDLLDRVTAYRAGMEPQAVELIEGELRSRGVSDAEIADYAGLIQRHALLYDDGTAVRCSFCHAPAMADGWGWFR